MESVPVVEVDSTNASDVLPSVMVAIKTAAFVALDLVRFRSFVIAHLSKFSNYKKKHFFNRSSVVLGTESYYNRRE